VDELTDVPGLVALASGGLALIALILAIVLAVKLRRLRAGQRVVLGAYGTADLVAHASDLHTAFTALSGHVEEVSERLDGAIAYRALVRYDAYGELSGHQSTTIALLDARQNGVVISTIAHRDTARMYCKQIHAGRGEQQLSPEEEEAIRLALAGEVGSVTLD